MKELFYPTVQFGYAGLFRSETKWIHPKRTETTYEIILVTHGEVCLREGEQEYHLQKGQLLLLEPHRCHWGTEFTTDVGFYWVHFQVMSGELPFSKRFFESFEVGSLFKELLHVSNLPNPPEYLVNAVLAHILAELWHRAQEAEQRYDDMAERIREWIRINADAGLTVRAVAEHFGYSADHITRVCRANFGVGAAELCNRFLINRAKELLCNTTLYVKEIGAELSFSDDKAFIGFFKYHEGCSPSTYRSRFSKLHMNNQ